MLSTQEIIARVWQSIRNNASTAEVVVSLLRALPGGLDFMVKYC